MLVPLLSLLALTTALPVDGTAKYWSLNAKKVVKSTNVKTHIEKRDNEYVSLTLNDEQTFYLATLELGSNDQKLGVLVDTGSSDFWVVASNNTYCESGTTGSLSKKGRSLGSIVNSEYLDDDYQSNIADNVRKAFSSSSSSSQMIDCSEYGTFDPSSSDSFTSNYTSFSITYADNTFADGTWCQDTLTFNNIEVKDMNFAYCDNTDNAQGVLGIGLAGLEVTYSNAGTSGSSYTYENLPLKLVADGIITKPAYSVYLNGDDDSEILFGAIDSSKYTGDLVELPIVNALYSMGYKNPIQLTVTLNTLSYINNKTSQAAEIGNGYIPALLDTGTTLTYMPQDIVTGFLNIINFQYSQSLQYYIGDCSAADNVQIRFSFQGLDIDIPMSNFLISLYTKSNSISSQCAFGIIASSDKYVTLGDSFLMSVYMVADLEKLTIALAKGTNNGSPDIQVIESSIPQAKQPASSKTYDSKNTAFSVNSSPTLASVNLSTTSSNDSATTSSSSSSATGSTSNTTTSSTDSSSSVSSTGTSSTNTSTTSTSSTNTSSTGTTSTRTSSTSTTVSSISSTKNKNGAVKLASSNFGFVVMLLALL